MNISFDKYSNKYYLQLEGWPTLALSFEELENLNNLLHQHVQDEYSKQLQEDFLDDGDTCDGCTI